MIKIMEYFSKIKFLYSYSNRQYVGCDVDGVVLLGILKKFQNYAPNVFEMARQNQMDRDENYFHITILSPSEFSNLNQNQRKILTSTYIDNPCSFEILGLGEAQNEMNFAYFGVVKSMQLDLMRETLEIAPRDFHVTIGFYDRDVHGVRKDETTLIS